MYNHGTLERKFTIVDRHNWKDFAEKLEKESDILFFRNGGNSRKPTEYNPFKEGFATTYVVVSHTNVDLFVSSKVDRPDDLINKEDFITFCRINFPKDNYTQI